jgi:lysophospholipase L1-like esterase
MIFNKRDGTNNCFADMYGTNTASGRASYVGAGEPGVYIANRRSSTDYKLYLNNIVKKSNTATQGSVPGIEVLLNGYKTTTTNGAGSNDNLMAIAYYTRSLTPTEVAAETVSWQNFAVAIKRTGTYAASVICDGDSHFAYWDSGFMREFHAQFWGNCINIQNIAVSGQLATDMSTNAATNLYPKIQAGRSTYYYIAGGGTNDIAGGASAATVFSTQQTIITNLKANAASKGVALVAIMIPLYNRLYAGNDAAILAQDAYNELVRNNVGVGDYYADFPSQYSAKLSDYSGNTTNFINAVRAYANDTNYFYDGTHLINGALGYPVPAAIIAQKIKQISGIS